MRVAMGLALNEIDREARAIEFYNCCRPSTSCRRRRRCSTAARALAAVELLPDHGGRRPGRHLRGLKENALLSKFAGGLGNDWTRARAGLAHQGHQRQVAGRGALPEGGQRHGRGREPGRQAQGRGLRLPGNLAPGHRRVPGAAQEHRRRPPPHPRHEHRELDSGPVHEARDRGRRVDPVLALHLPRPARPVGKPSRPPTPPTKPRPTAARSSCSSACRPRTCGARC
jgi:ribonucleoside-diphosphate reductase alpha chain